MKDINQIINQLQQLKYNLNTEYCVKEISIFGSYSRNEASEGSDLDILVEFGKKPSLLKFINLKNFLNDLLEIKVDLVMKSALKPSLKDAILTSIITI